MPLSYPEIRTFSGLHLQSNSFSVPDGAMEKANNIVISKDNVAQKCRGQYRYYDPSSDTINQLAVYQDKLLGIFSDKIGYFTDSGSSPNYTGTRTTLSGATVDITSGRISRTVQSNKNFYWTTDQGLLKLESYSGTVQKAGTPQGLDLRAKFLPSTGPIAAEKLVGWRILFGKRDGNDNLLLGAPSEIITLTNSMVTGCTYTSSGAGPYTVTVTSSGHNLATGMSITVSAATDTDANGARTVTVTSATQFTFSTSADPTSGTLSYTVTRSSRLEFTVPSEITSTSEGYFYRIYRSSQVADTATSISSDFKLVEEKALTSAEITAKVVFYNDDIDDILRSTELYTNENSQEGETQANYRPPLSTDVCLYKGFTAYGGVTMRHLIDFQIVDAAAMAAADYVQTMVVIDEAATYTSTGAGPYTVTVTSAAHGLTTGQTIFVDNATDADAEGTFTVTVSSSSVFTYSTASGNPNSGTLLFGLVRRYVARTGVANATVSSTSIAAQAVTSDLEVTYASHGLSNGDTIYISNVTGTLAAGTYYVVGATANTFEISLTNGGSSIDWIDETALDFQGVTNGTYPIFKLDITSSASVQLRDTARGLVKAINRDTASLVYAAYSSGISEVPGKIRLQTKGFLGPIYLMGNDAATGVGFNPVLPSAFDTGTQVYSRNDELPHVVSFSKFEEPESTPLGNQVQSGSSNKSILRILPLRDSLIVLKLDGVYRITGDSISNFSSTPLDTTVICVAPDSAAVLNNEVYFLSNQGVCRVTESSINIISRKIEDVIQPIVGSTVISAQTSGCAYESERFYLMTTIEPGETSANITYAYNILSDSWTTWSISAGQFLFKRALVGPNDVLYMVNTSGIVKKERKNQNRIDYCNQNYSTTVVSVAADSLSAVVTFGSGDAVPVAGDVLELNSVFSRISVASFISGTTYDLTFEVATGLAAADTPVYYEKYDSEIKFAPFHAGLVGRMKMFVELQLHFRNNAAGAFAIVFSGDTFGSSEETEWSSLLIPRGWGDFPWGFEPWGNQDGIDLPLRSGPAPMCRLDIPRYQKRGTFIQATILHTRAGDPINLQALTWVVRAYNERVTR